MAKRTKYHQVIDGEWVRPAARGFKEQCCGCGLVHRTDYRVVDGAVEFRATVDARATAAVRRAFKFTPDDA
jgi:hypothetical protein